MTAYVLLGLAVAGGAFIIYLRGRQQLKGAQLGDFVKVAIPRTLENGRPLAVGTRLDIAAALKKKGVPVETLRPLIDGGRDAELLALYWSNQQH